jgi:PPK2 family polyphosphate:nucleotide phosphotransferase
MATIKLKDYEYKASKSIDKEAIKAETIELQEKIGAMQKMLYAQKKYAVLVVLQGMDASGKDGSTKAMLKETIPTGIEYIAFKKPTDEEFAHDFLWRIHKVAPQKGVLKIFNRSHYEEVLIQRVHKWVDEDRIKNRMEAINAFEKLLHFDNNTIVVKCFLNISHEKQLEKLQERIDVPEKQWKHNPGDWEETKLWDQYMDCYEDVLNKCNAIPWNIVPCDNEWYRDYTVCKILYDALKDLDLEYPPLKK